MLIKAGVDISRLKPPIRKKLWVIKTIAEETGSLELIITSTYEGTHAANSLHYANLAMDIRRGPQPAKTTKRLRFILGDDYDIVAEKDHIHIEYDPK